MARNQSQPSSNVPTRARYPSTSTSTTSSPSPSAAPVPSPTPRQPSFVGSFGDSSSSLTSKIIDVVSGSRIMPRYSTSALKAGGEMVEPQRQWGTSEMGKDRDGDRENKVQEQTDVGRGIEKDFNGRTNGNGFIINEKTGSRRMAYAVNYSDFSPKSSVPGWHNNSSLGMGSTGKRRAVPLVLDESVSGAGAGAGGSEFMLEAGGTFGAGEKRGREGEGEGSADDGHTLSSRYSTDTIRQNQQQQYHQDQPQYQNQNQNQKRAQPLPPQVLPPYSTSRLSQSPHARQSQIPLPISRVPSQTPVSAGSATPQPRTSWFQSRRRKSSVSNALPPVLPPKPNSPSPSSQTKTTYKDPLSPTRTNMASSRYAGLGLGTGAALSSPSPPGQKLATERRVATEPSSTTAYGMGSGFAPAGESRQRISPMAARYLPQNQGISPSNSPSRPLPLPQSREPVKKPSSSLLRQNNAQHNGKEDCNSTSSSGSSFRLPPIPKSLSGTVFPLEDAINQNEADQRNSNVDSPLRGSNRIMTDNLSPLGKSLPTPNSALRTPSQSYSSDFDPAAFLSSPPTPGAIDPRLLDRQGLIGVGELTTPRWAQSHKYQNSVDTMVSSFARSPAQDKQVSQYERLGYERSPLSNKYGESRRTASMAVSSSTSTDLTQLNDDSSTPPIPSVPTRVRSSRVVSGPRMRVSSTSYRQGDEADTAQKTGPQTAVETPTHGHRPLERPQYTAASSGFLDLPSSIGDFSMVSSLDNAFDKIAASAGDNSASPAVIPAGPDGARNSPKAVRPTYSLKAASDLQARNETEVPRRKSTNYPPSSDIQSPIREHRLGTRRSIKDLSERPPPREHKTSISTVKSPQSQYSGYPNHSDLTPGQSIIRQFGSTRDFSHLPPSPSTASINQFMLRESSSMHNFSPVISQTDRSVLESPSSRKLKSSNTPPATQTHNYPQQQQARSVPSISSLRSARQRDLMDKATADTIRKLDGLGSKHSSSNLKHKASPGLKKHQEAGDTGRSHEFSGSDGDGAGRRDKRSSSSSTSADASTPRTPSNQSSGPGSTNPAIVGASGNSKYWNDGSSGNHRSSAGSDGADSFRSWDPEMSGLDTVPPVPPLPKNLANQSRCTFSTRSQTMADLPRAAEYVPVKEPSMAASQQTVSQLSNSNSSPALGFVAQFDQQPLTSALASPPLSDDSSTKPRRMSKKWSFSSAFNGFKGRAPQISDDELHSPRISHAEQLSSSPPTAFTETFPSSVNSMGSMSDMLKVPSMSTSTETGVSDAHVLSQGHFSRKPSTTGLPFFRRTSSTSVSSKTTGSQTVKYSKSSQGSDIVAGHAKQPSQSASSSRMTILGVGIPSLLKGSNSRRNLTVPEGQEPVERSPVSSQLEFSPSPEKRNSLSWSSRKRGKSINGSLISPPQSTKPLPPMHVRDLPQSGIDGASSLKKRPSRERLQSCGGMENMQPASSGLGLNRSSFLPAIVGSPSGPSSAESPHRTRSPSTATPTKIPRLVAKPTVRLPSPKKASLPPQTSVRQKPRTSTTRSSLPVARDRLPPAEASKHTEFGAERSSYTPRAIESPRTEDSPTTDSLQSHTAPRKVISMIPASRRALPEPPAGDGLANGRQLPPAPVADDEPKFARDSDGFLRPQKVPNRSGNGVTSSVSQPLLGVPRPATGRYAQGSSSSRATSPGNALVDEDEIQGDEEMATFLKTQRAKRASEPARKCDIDAFLNFPEPGAPRVEMMPHAFIKSHFESLSMFERREILDFSSIWFSGKAKDKTAATPDNPANNYGYDDERGDYLIHVGDHLAYRYEILAMVGSGSFGRVCSAIDHATGECVAIKIIRNKKRFHSQAVVEIKILENVVKIDGDRNNMVKIIDHFSFRNHLCIVTELLSLNLYELVKANNFVGFSTTLIRRFAVQLLACLQVMRSNRIIHCDLKPENILLKHPARSGIKVIDFGSSCYEHEKVYTYIQSRFYRSPEVILGKEYSMGIDVWSFGCILAEMFTGFPIFPGENEQEQLTAIMEVMGVPDKAFVSSCSRKKVFFDGLGQPRPYVNSKGKRRRPGGKTLSSVLRCEDELFVDFIAKCLIWDPEKRMKPAQAMKHPWILAGRKIAAPKSQAQQNGMSSYSRPTEEPQLSSAASSSMLGSSSGSVRLKAGPLFQDKLKSQVSSPSPLNSMGANTSVRDNGNVLVQSHNQQQYGHFTHARKTLGSTRA